MKSTNAYLVFLLRISLLFGMLVDNDAFAPSSRSLVSKSTRCNLLPAEDLFTDGLPSSQILSVAEIGLDWSHPGQAIGTLIFLAYVGVSLAAGLKYVVKDGWRPKF
mmetsp:Transcript_8405/g.12191  ORF Transcript_8405/g.12191 Transcript_8405/m.12191 type:complete len:106 (-) Transcript_8405:66-383(-)